MEKKNGMSKIDAITFYTIDTIAIMTIFLVGRSIFES